MSFLVISFPGSWFPGVCLFAGFLVSYCFVDLLARFLRLFPGYVISWLFGFLVSWSVKFQNYLGCNKLFLPMGNSKSCWDIWGVGTNNLFHSLRKTMFLEETQTRIRRCKMMDGPKLQRTIVRTKDEE
jgi:energy-coupling factor transporter transmembrane protein EcfT